MWELIRENKRKSWIIFICMGICLILLGGVVGAIWFSTEGVVIGIFIALCIWVLLSVISYTAGDSIILSASNAKKVTRDVHPRLFNIVEEMKISANLQAMPQIYIIDDPAPNAFATGKNPEKSSIAVTAGLLSALNRDELQGVIAHEMSHIINRDVLYVTFAGIMLGSIVILSEVFLRSLWYSGGSSRRYRVSSSSKSGGQAQAIIMVIAIVVAILAPIMARLFYFALSRKREYLADASAVRLTRYPEGLASALDKISNTNINFAAANKITAPMYIAMPLKNKKMNAMGLLSTHPPIKERIRILRNLAHGVSYADYQKAYTNGKGNAANIMPQSALSDSENIPIRKPFTEDSKTGDEKIKKRELWDLMRTLNKYIFLSCICGLKIKFPPNFKKQEIKCPRCKRNIEVPLDDIKATAAMVGIATMHRNA